MKTLAVIASTCTLFTIVGCVSQQTYDKTRAEADELTRALEMARIDVKELEQRIDMLQAVNKKEDAATTEIRAAIQREIDTAPLMRQRADNKIAALQTQAAHLISQSRLLGRQVAEAKQEGASLQAVVTQYKQDLEDSRLLSLSTPSMPPAPAPPIPSPSSTVTPMVPTPTPLTAPAQQAQANPNPPTKPAATTRHVKGEPAQTDDSWTGMIKNWVSSVWGWIFG